MDQRQTPLADALFREAHEKIIPFDVPGHKSSNRFSALNSFFGRQCVMLDKNSRNSIDNLCQPSGVIMEAEMLAADTFSSTHAIFMINGTTSSVQAMIMSACLQGDKIILPRNVHSSVINAIILSGAIPVYINPGIHSVLGISLGMNIEDVEDSILRNTDAKAILINNPTYYGICSNLKEIILLAHRYNILVLVDEAHGTHFYFSDDLPPAAMQCGADMSAVSMHKTGGSLTQSSILLIGNKVDINHVRSVVNIMRTTSSSYLLLASLDLARSFLAVDGKRNIALLIESVQKARKKINQIDGYYAFADEIVDHATVEHFDTTKLCINTTSLGLAGIEVYKILRNEHNIQLEFGDVCNILAMATIGDETGDLDKLVLALDEIKKHKSREKELLPLIHEFIQPIIKISPHKAFYSHKHSVPLLESEGMICGDYIMCYPPGIPIVAPGELITSEILDYIEYTQKKGSFLTGMADTQLQSIQIVD